MQTKKVVSGIFLIILSVFLGIGAFYQWEIKPELALRGNFAEESAKETSVAPVNEAATRETIKIPLNKEEKIELVESVKALVDENEIASVVNIAPEKSKKDKLQGFLWINRKTSKYVVTLGKKNGLQIGSTLLVYQNDEKIGKVEVDTLYDTIAYVHPIDISAELSEGDYYRVVPQ